MASSSGRCLVNRNNYGGELERDPRYRPNEIYLYYNNALVVKAERGVTLGLIKLIYTSDDNNPGLLLGVRPRLRDKVPCLITFDSTCLMHDAYDLIVHESISPGDPVQPNTAVISNNNDCQQTVPYMHPPEREPTMHPPVSHSVHASNPSLTSHNWLHQPIPPPVSMPPPAQPPAPPPAPPQAPPPPVSTATQLSAAPVVPTTSLSQQQPDTSGPTRNFEEVFNQHLNQTLQEVGTMEAERSIRASTRKTNDSRPTMAFRDEAQEDDASNESNPEPDSTETPEKFPFKPENFDFDIKSVIPIQTESGLRWPCDRCNKHYCSASHLKRHWILHTDFRPYCCTLCDKKFPFHWDLKRHMTKHTGNKRFKCSSCDKSFNTQKELKCHGWLHTGKKLYKCQVCNHELSSSGNLKVHMRKHTGVKPYKCEFCPRAFYMLGHYQYHKMRHTGIKPYKCEICGKTFSFSLNLREHNNIHTGEKPYSCPKCDKRFAHRSTLKQHILVHGGERPYKCHICSKDFVQSSNYRMHLLTHQDKELRIQKCDLCGKELISRRWVTKHRTKCLKKMMQEKEGAPKSPKEPRQEHKCETCSKVFKYRANYESHLKKAHIPGAEEPKKTKTPKTPKTPKVPKATKATKKSAKNSVSCPICNKMFQFVSGVKKHLQRRHAGVEMAIPQNLESTSDLKDSSFAITSGEDSRVIIRSASSTNSDGTTSVNDVSKGEKIEIVPIGQPVPTIHIQPTGKAKASQKNLTFIFVPSKSPTKSPEGQSKETDINSPSDTRESNSSATSPEGENVSKDKQPETGSQAISALKKLNAKVGGRNGRTVKSKHLSAIEQLNKRVGSDKSVTLEAVHTVSRDLANHQTVEKVDERHDDKASGVGSRQHTTDSRGGQE